MRLLSTQIEELAPLRFILAVALAAGGLDSIPTFFSGHGNSAGGRSIQLVAVAAISVLWLAAGMFLLWGAVRRRSYSVWRIAWHLTLALALGDVLAFALTFAAASIDTQGAYVTAYVHAPLSVTVPGLLAPTLLRSPIRFLGWAAAVALGRLWLGSARPFAPRSLTSRDREAVT